MYGWRLRVGVIVPADNAVTEPELAAHARDGISFHAARLTTEEREAMPDEAVRAAAVLGRLDVGAVAYACGETSALAGPDALAARLADAAGVPATTATQSVIAALEALGLRRIALVTPYRPQYGAAMEASLTDAGLVVVRATHHRFGPEDPAREWRATNEQTPERVYRLVREAHGADDVDAVVLPATNLRSLPVLAALRHDLGVPVLAANQCLLWWCLRAGGLATEARVVLAP